MSPIGIAASGLGAAQTRLYASAVNIASGEEAPPVRAVQSSTSGGGVKATVQPKPYAPNVPASVDELAATAGGGDLARPAGAAGLGAVGLQGQPGRDPDRRGHGQGGIRRHRLTGRQAPAPQQYVVLFTAAARYEWQVNRSSRDHDLKIAINTSPSSS